MFQMEGGSSTQERGQRLWDRIDLPLVVTLGLLVGALVAAGWLLLESRAQADRTADDFSRQVATQLESRAANARLSLALLGASLQDSQGPDGASQFEALAAPAIGAGLEQVGWLPRIESSGRAGFEERIGSSLASLDGSTVVVAPPRTRYFPVALSAQIGSGNLDPAGLDHGSVPDRSRAMTLAARSASSHSAGPTPSGGDDAVIIYVAVYGPEGDPGAAGERQRALTGYVFGSVTAAGLDALARSSAPEGVDVSVSFDAHAGPGAARFADVPISVNAGGIGSSWAVPLIVLASGLALAGLVWLLFRLVATRERDERRSQELVRDERDRSRAVMSALQDGLLVVDEDMTIDGVNARLSEIVGIDERELVGVQAPFSFAPDEGRLAEIFEEVGVLGVGEFEFDFVDASGTSVPVILSVAKRIDPGHRTAGYVCTVKDITARKRAEARLRERDAENQALASQQTALRTVATAVARELDPDAVFKLVAREAYKLTGGEVGGVARIGGDPRSGVVVAWAARREGLVPARLSLHDPDTTVGRGTVLGSRRADQPSNAIVALIRSAGDVWGAVFAESSDPDALSNRVEGGIEGLAELASLAIANDDARRRLESAASTDPLTGLANRRTFDERLRHEAALALRAGQPLSLVLGDIDHFKAVNDSHGHQVGDRVLVEAAARLVELARVGDLVARVGGEEFAWILTETDSSGALAAAERARVAIRGKRFASAGQLTISLGVATLMDHSDADRLVAQADAALYWAKQHGRDQSRIYTSEIGADPSQRGRRTGVARARAQEGLRTLMRGIEQEIDPGARSRSDRVAQLAGALAEGLGWAPADTARLREAALIYDVGWISVPTPLRRRRGTFRQEDLVRMRLHAEAGANMAGEVLDEDQALWIRHHHERWDGGGYPDGLSAEDIPGGARILAVADAWAAMTSDRQYLPRLTPRQATAECAAQSGRQFCPVAVRVLKELHGGERTSSSAAVFTDL